MNKILYTVSALAMGALFVLIVGQKIYMTITPNQIHNFDLLEVGLLLLCAISFAIALVRVDKSPD